MLKVLDLFSGIGGFSLGLERTGGFETVTFCEIEEYPQKVLAKHWPDVPIYPDIRKLTKERLDNDGITGISVLTGGYPCQPFSLAGDRRGTEDDRHLWPEVARLVQEIRPDWCIFENVAGHVSMGLDEVLSDLERIGYTCEPFIIPACALGAHHRRDRLWLIAYPDSKGLQERFVFTGIQGETGRNDYGEDSPLDGGRFARPELVRRLHGIPNRMDRIKSLGNSVIPQIPEIIGRAILKVEAQRRAIEIIGGMHVSPGALYEANQ